MTRQEKQIEIAKEGNIKFLVFDLDDKQNQFEADGKIYRNISYIRYEVNNKLYSYFNIEDVIVYASKEPLVIFSNQYVYVHDDDLKKQSLIMKAYKDLVLYKYIVD